MLSFMKEDGNQKSAPESSKLAERISDAEEQEEIQTEDYLVPSASQKKVKYSTMILGVVFVAGVLSLFTMIKKSTPAEAQAGLSEQELKIESAIAKLTGSKTQMNGKMNDIVNMIASLSDVVGAVIKPEVNGDISINDNEIFNDSETNPLFHLKRGDQKEISPGGFSLFQGLLFFLGAMFAVQKSIP